ncbi:helix-turn-helix domain-containing protein [Syntrophothermus sp.]|uniref:helix-turn-helix domain-containing protein n=1 Tax=Syntrophothermus sp. TaxID=2736299 RepID=UPI00258109F3|nr:helix-turn-helix domain-containing protein [Syntrophothermus sp.]
MRSRREKLGYTLEQAEEETKIRKYYLKALEDENFAVLPARVYAIGFVRRYARFLSLNEDEAVQWFKEMVMPKEYEIEDDTEGEEKSPRLKTPAIKWQNVLAAVVFLILAIWLGTLVVGYFSHHIKENRSTPPTTSVDERTPSTGTKKTGSGMGTSQVKPAPGKEEENSKNVAGTQAGEKAGSGTKEQSTPSSGGVQLPEKEVTVKLRATDRSWVSIYVNGERAFSGIMNPNEETQVQGYKVTLTIGNAGGILVTVDGKELGYLGKSREVIRDKVFTSGS